MSDFQLNTAVALIIFNRPDTTEKAFAAIAVVKPPKLLVIADGPRPDRPGEAEKCAVARAIIDLVDWDCEVLKNYSDVNLGCRWRVSSGLDWVFEQVEEAIIVEDDCLPHPTFFRFCEELLEYYRDDERIMVISGNNFQLGRLQNKDSYYFSRYPHCWGWSTWKRSWKYHEVEMKFWPTIRDAKILQYIFQNSHQEKYWQKIFQYTYDEKLSSWNASWTFSCWMQNSLTILPSVNLVSNIGFSEQATHTRGKSRLANLPVQAMEFPLKHPTFMIRNAQADNFTERIIFSKTWLTMQLLRLSKIVKGDR